MMAGAGTYSRGIRNECKKIRIETAIEGPSEKSDLKSRTGRRKLFVGTNITLIRLINRAYSLRMFLPFVFGFSPSGSSRYTTHKTASRPQKETIR